MSQVLPGKVVRRRQQGSRPVARLPAQLAGPMAHMLRQHMQALRRLSRHANRVCHFDQLLAAHLMGFWQPVVRSLRTMDARTVLDPAMNQALGDVRLARSTLGDAMSQMPASALLPLLTQLLKRLPAACTHPHMQDLVALKKRIHAIDGSYFQLPADVLWALAHKRSNAKAARQLRMDMHLDILRFVPVKVQASGQADGAEWKALARTLEPGVIYLADRGFVARGFIRQVIDRQSDCVVRLKGNTRLELVHAATPSAQDLAAGVLADQRVTLPASRWCRERIDQTLRLIVVQDSRSGQQVRLLTTLMDTPAHVIGKLYRHRWSIELFFRWLKCVAWIKRFYSQSPNGITLQLYCVIIATLLAYLATGQKPGMTVSLMMDLAARGQLRMDRLAQVLERDARARELERLGLLRKKNA